MKITTEDVERIAKLSMLRLSESETESCRNHLEGVLLHMEKLNSVKTDEIEPLSNIGANRNILRNDAPEEFGNKEKIWTVAPVSEKQRYIVPRVVE